MNKLGRALRSPAVEVAAILIALLHVVRIAQVLPTRIFTYDFNHYYVSSRMLLDGRNPYRTPLARYSEDYGFEHSDDIAIATNPPLLLWLFAPLTVLPPRAAFWVWVAVEASSLVIVLWLTRRLLLGQLTLRGWRLLCAGVVASAPIFLHFAFSHVELLLAAVLLAAYFWHREGKYLLACATVLLVALVKIYPIVLLPWFVWKSPIAGRKRMLCGCALVAAAIGLVLLTGLPLWSDFFAHALPTIRRWSVGHTFNFTVPSLVINVGQTVCYGSAALEPNRWWWAAGAAVSLAVAGAAYVFCAVAGQDEDVQFSVLCAAMLAGGLTAWGYYFVLLIFPVAVAVTRMVGASLRRGLWLAAILVMLDCQGVWDTLPWTHWPLGKVLVNYVPLYGVLGLAIASAIPRVQAQPTGAR